MQTFIDTATQKVWSFDDDVKASNAAGVYSFETHAGEPLDAPTTLQPYTVPAQTAEQIATQALLQSAHSAMASGIVIASTVTPALNGTYPIDQLSQMDIIAIETSINAGKGFPGGSTPFSFPDSAGVMHAFTEANFTNFAAAVRDYVYALKSVMTGASTALPSSTSTIA